MIDLDRARDIAEKYVAGKSAQLPYPHNDLIILDQRTIEKPYGWVFFYTSKSWFETRDAKFAIAGNGPFLVKQENGEIQQFGTAHPVEWWIDEYERGVS